MRSDGKFPPRSAHPVRRRAGPIGPKSCPPGQGPSWSRTMIRFGAPRRVLVWLMALVVLACVPPDPSSARTRPAEGIAEDGSEPGSRSLPSATVVLISLDGTRADDVTEAQLPSLVALGRKGVRAEALVPVDPSNTFPAHVSLVTGVLPEEHRLVNNQFIDPVRGRFSRKKTAPHSWIESEPVWSIAERHGIPTAAFHWVGSEGPWKSGPGPRTARRFSSRTLEKTKVTQILEWLAIEDPAERPRLITSWFHGADHAAHVSGPG
ncbi:MAG TPA: alkaline phosphatase family protein, partial [Deltaproteobacteria bacterium]|nr:alkaline phosphatase family protein [Deltaproteobacteria bacterium]